MAVLIITSPASPLQIVELACRPQIVGRSVTSDIHIADRSISRSHARIDFDETTGRHTIEDLSSFNGMYLGSERIETAHTLRDGDTLSLGSATVRFRAELHAPEHADPSVAWSRMADVPTAAPEWAVRTPWRDSALA